MTADMCTLRADFIIIIINRQSTLHRLRQSALNPLHVQSHDEERGTERYINSKHTSSLRRRSLNKSRQRRLF